MSVPERRESHRFIPDLLDLLESPFTTWRPTVQAAGQTIRVEDYVDNGTYTVRAELPDIDPEKDVEITVAGDILRIHAERHTERKEGHRSEFRYGSFTRSVPLPRGVTAKDITASYDKGILSISIPLPEAKEEAQRITVHTPKNTS